MEKVQIKIWIPKDLNDKFRKTITQKFPKYGKAQLSRVATYAFELYIRMENTQNTQQHNARNIQGSKRKSFRTITVWKECKDFLIKIKYVDEYDIPVGAELPDKLLQRAIEFVRGEDQRTVDTWIEKFLKHDIIKKSGPHQYEVIWDENYEFEQSIAEDKQKGVAELNNLQNSKEGIE